MDLADLIAAENQKPGPQCSVQRVLEHLDKKNAATLRAALANKALTSASLTRAIRKLELPIAIGNESVGRHRKGECACAPR